MSAEHNPAASQGTTREKLDEDDHDLLTFGEAGERLRGAIAAEARAVAELEGSGRQANWARPAPGWPRCGPPRSATPHSPSTTRISRSSSATRGRPSATRPARQEAHDLRGHQPQPRGGSAMMWEQ